MEHSDTSSPFGGYAVDYGLVYSLEVPSFQSTAQVSGSWLHVLQPSPDPRYLGSTPAI